MELEVAHDRGTRATTKANTPVREPRPTMVTPENIKKLTDVASEDFPKQPFHSDIKLEVGHSRKPYRDGCG